LRPVAQLPDPPSRRRGRRHERGRPRSRTQGLAGSAPRAGRTALSARAACAPGTTSSGTHRCTSAAGASTPSHAPQHRTNRTPSSPSANANNGASPAQTPETSAKRRVRAKSPRPVQTPSHSAYSAERPPGRGVVAPPQRISRGRGSRGCQKPLGFAAFIVGAALMVAGVVVAGPAVAVCPKDMSPVIAVAVCPWPIAATSAPTATKPLAAIAAARHLSCLFRIFTPPFRSFAASSPSENGPLVPPRVPALPWVLLRYCWEATGSGDASEQSWVQWRGSLCSAASSGCCSLGAGLAGVACGAAAGAVPRVELGAAVGHVDDVVHLCCVARACGAAELASVVVAVEYLEAVAWARPHRCVASGQGFGSPLGPACVPRRGYSRPMAAQREPNALPLRH